MIFLSGDTKWDPSYADTSSEKFKQLASKMESDFFNLFRITKRDSLMKGIKVLGMRKGSVIIDVLITYKPTATTENIINEFKQTIRTNSTVSRIMKNLKIIEDRPLEYVPVVVGINEGGSVEKCILIGVVIALIVVIGFIGGIAFYKEKQKSNIKMKTVKGQDNQAVET